MLTNGNATADGNEDKDEALLSKCGKKGFGDGSGGGGGGGVLVCRGALNDKEIMTGEEDGHRLDTSGNIAVHAGSRMLEVQAAGDDPHLVSLGNDRFSTAVTVHPLPKGRVSVGSSPSADIRIRGTGVREVHCWFENDGQVVVVCPNGVDVAIQIDGVNATQPSRLSQGCMLRFGRSNFFKFNHPQEAKYMRSVLPANTRVSMMPNAFCLNDLPATDNKPTTFDSRRSYDSLADSLCDVSSGTSSEDLLNASATRPNGGGPHQFLKNVAPKVFSPGSSNLNSPASVVLARRKQQPGNAALPNGNGPFSYNSVSVYEDQVERSLSNGYCGAAGVGDNDQNNNHHHDRMMKNGGSKSNGDVEYSSCESLSPRTPRIIPPSPAFNRTPSYMVSQKGVVSSPSHDYGSFSASCNSPSLYSSSPSFAANHRHGTRTSIVEKNGSLSSPTNGDHFVDSTATFENGGLRKLDSEAKRKQAHQNRILEQERERVERLRLEEILTACVDYEKQAQYDRHTKPQVRIKTNGSLSREKQSMSPLARTPESPRDGLVFTFDKSDVVHSETNVTHTPNERFTYHNSPRTRIKTVVSPKIIRKETSFDQLDCRLALLNEREVDTRSPFARRANANGSGALSSEAYNTNLTNGDDFKGEKHDLRDSFSRSPILDSTTRRKYEFLGVESSEAVAPSSPMSQSYHESLPPNNENNGLARSPNIMSVSLIDFDANEKDKEGNSKYELSNYSSNEYSMSKSQTLSLNGSTTTTTTAGEAEKADSIEKLNGLVSDLNEIIRSSTPRTTAEDTGCKARPKNEFSKFILPLEEIDNVLRRQRFTMKKCELKKLQTEHCRLMEAINKVKNKLLDIQRQKDEIIRELEMEKALLEGELKAENDKLTSEEKMLNMVHERMTSCEKQIETCSRQQRERQHQNKSIIDEQQNTLNILQSNLACIKNEADKASIMESIGRSREILEEETKSFEDFEFRLLEEEALLLSRRDEYQGELNKISNEVEHSRSKISNLYSQKEQLLQNASDEIKSLELQVRCHTRTLQQNHNRLQEINTQVKETSKLFNGIHAENGDDSCDESWYPYKSQSQEDLDRISRVTSDAPIMENGSNSLGRRTIASLQQIERNRQLHLAEQGSQVIEEERKRMVALKQRVQDEVKAQWEEERKQREHNCTSITSIGSDVSSVLSSDRIAKSSSTDDQLLVNGHATQNGDGITFNGSIAKEKPDEDELELLGKSSSHVTCNNVTVKMRTNKSTSLCQRPESRFSVYSRQPLDLRQHIEGAGHQVDHCPHVFVDKTSCRGYLHKMTTKFRTWNKRWFVFDRTKCSFAYYSDKNEKKYKGGARFEDLLDLLCMDNNNSIKSSNPSATFIIKSKERVYYLLAPSIEAMRIWFDVLATEIEAYLDS